MAGGAAEGDEDITGINVTPLVDVMLVLLIIFMVTANYIVNQSIAVNLPKAETADTKAPSKNMAFTLDAKGTLFLDGQPITFEEIKDKIVAFKKDEPTASVNAIIAADQTTPHGQVVKLIDTVRKHGITDFAINVEAAPSSP
jgi:biopolymer transport protein ExbD